MSSLVRFENGKIFVFFAKTHQPTYYNSEVVRLAPEQNAQDYFNCEVVGLAPEQNAASNYSR
jgi:hypothetical protein